MEIFRLLPVEIFQVYPIGWRPQGRQDTLEGLHIPSGLEILWDPIGGRCWGEGRLGYLTKFTVTATVM